MPRPDTVLFDLDLSADQVPAWHLEEPRGVARVNGELIVADAQRHHLVNLDTLEVIGREGSAEGEFREPHGIAVGEAIYVADAGNHRIQKFNLDWEFLDAWGGYGTEHGELNRPEGVAIAGDGSVFVTDTGNARVHRFTREGDPAGYWLGGANDVPMVRPTGIAFAPPSEVYVADAGTGLIHRFGLDGEALGVFSPAEWHHSASMVAVLGRAPTGPPDRLPPPLVWLGSEESGAVGGFDLEGNRVGGASVAGLLALGGAPDDVLVGSSEPGGWTYGRAAVHSLTPGGEPGRAQNGRDALWAPGHSVGPYIQQPTDADVAPDGSILVSSWAAPGVKRFWKNGRPAGQWDSPGWRSSVDPQCLGPASLSAAADGTVFVANVCAGSVERWSLTGELLSTWPLVADGAAAEVSAVAAMPGGGAVVADGIWDQIVVLAADGTPGIRFGGSGSERAQLRLPRWSETTASTGIGLDTDAQGRIYVSDEVNGRVKVFDADGAVVSVIIPEPDRDYLTRYGPGPLSVAPDGTFYLADAYREPTLVQRFALDGTHLGALVVRCSDARDRPGCVVPFGNEWDSPEKRPVIAATNDGGIVAVGEDGLYWYTALGQWQGHVRDTRDGELPTAALARGLAVSPNLGAMVAAEGRGLVNVSAEGALESRWQDTLAPSEIVQAKYRTVPLEHPSAVAVTSRQTSFVLDLFGRLMLLDQDGSLLKLLQPNTNGDVLGLGAVRGTDGRIYIDAPHTPLDQPGLLVYSEDGTLLDTIVTGTSGDDVAIGPDGIIYYAAANGILGVHPGTDPVESTNIYPGPEYQLVSAAVDPVHTVPGASYVLWAADRTGRLLRFTPDGTALDEWDGSAAGGGPLAHPSSIRVAPNGSVWVLYNEGRRLRAYTHGTPGGWRTTYHHGSRAQGAPIFAERLNQPAATWGAQPPADGLLPGQWSARVERWMELGPGEQSFHVNATGGARLWVGERLVLDASARDDVEEVAQVDVSGGLTRVVLEYSHRTGDASFQLDVPVEILPTATPPQPTPRVSSTPDRPRPRNSKTAYLPLVRRDLDPPFVDRFDDPDSGWPNVNTSTTLMEYRDGEYRIVNRTADNAAYVISDLRRKNLDVQISARVAGSERGYQGLVFGAEVTGPDPLTVATQFLFVVQPDVQQWGLFLCTDTCGRVQLGNSRNIRKDGGLNTLRVTWQTPWLRIYLNGDRVWQRFQGPYNPDLYHGLVAGPVDAGHDARFDDYIVAEAWEEPARSDSASGTDPGLEGSPLAGIRPPWSAADTRPGPAIAGTGRPWLAWPVDGLSLDSADRP